MRHDEAHAPAAQATEQTGGGPRPSGQECLPSSSPPGKIFHPDANTLKSLGIGQPRGLAPVDRSPKAQPGFGGETTGTKHSRDAFAKKHDHVRRMPKPEGWKPYRGGAMFSVEDVLHIRASSDDPRVLAAQYGCGEGTIQRIRRNHQARVLTRWRSQRGLSELDLPSGELASMMAREIVRVGERFAKPLRLALAKERRAAGKLTRVAKRKLKEAGRG